MKFRNVAIVYKQKEKDAAHHSEAAAHQNEMSTAAPLLVCERSTSAVASYNRVNLGALLMDPAWLYHTVEHVLYLLII